MSTLAADALAGLGPRHAVEQPASSAIVAREPGRYRSLLMLRFGVINLVGFALLGTAWQAGWIGQILDADTTHICKLIFGVFLLGLALSAQKVWMLSQELNALDVGPSSGPGKIVSFMFGIAGRGGDTRQALATVLRLKLAHRIAPVRHIASTLVLLGLIGTIVGFVIALSGVNQDAVGDATAIGPMVATLLHGMAMALYKTLVGSVLNVWLMVDYRLLEGGAVHVLTRAIEEGEHNATA